MLMKHRFIVLTGLLFILSGCSNNLNLQVESDVPTPLATRLPLSLGIHYTESFRNFIYEENTEERENWVIDNRDSRLSLFNEILPTMFTSVAPVDRPDTSDTTVDVILEPEVVEMQVALPQETHSDMYEAWIKYIIKMYDPGAGLITQWQITGYGKSHTAMFKNREKGLATAINQALRDIGAKLVLDLPRVPEVRSWLSTRIDCNQYPELCS